MAVILRNQEYGKIITKLINARKAKGLTQIDVAKSLKVDQVTISRLETKATQLDILQFKKLCDLYGVKMQDILS